MEHLIGNLIEDYEQGKINRRQLIQSLAMAASLAGTARTALAAGKGFQAVAVNHISYNVADYARTRDFYADLLGMKVSHDDGKQCSMAFGDAVLLPRNTRRGRKPPVIDHLAYTIEKWDGKLVEDELKRRGLNPRADTENSFHIKDPDGFDVQICGKNMKV